MLLFASGWRVGVFGCGFPVCGVCYSSRFGVGLFVIVSCGPIACVYDCGRNELSWGLFGCVLLLPCYGCFLLVCLVYWFW